MNVIIHVYIPIVIFINGLALILTIVSTANNDTAGFSWCNPCFIYNHTKVNWFGAIFLALIVNITLPFTSILYWLYKLCTFGRK